MLQAAETLMCSHLCLFADHTPNSYYFILFFVEPHEWNVRFSCNYDVGHPWHINCSLHQNRLHGYPAEPLSTFWHHICFYRWVRLLLIVFNCVMSSYNLVGLDTYALYYYWKWAFHMFIATQGNYQSIKYSFSSFIIIWCSS